MEINVLVWNIMIPVLPPLRYFGQFERAERIPEVIQTINESETILDVIVFNELIPLVIYDIITSKLQDLGFFYTTKRIQDILTESGGISIYSRYPIVDEGHTLYGSECAISDCLSAKGVVYAKIDKMGFIANILGTHFQAGEQYQSIREAQTQMVSNFIKKLNIPKEEPLLFCGDLNMCRFLNNAEIKHLTYKLNMDLPQISESSHPFTFDPRINPLVGIDDPTQYVSREYPNGCADHYYNTKNCICCDNQWLDFSLVSKSHLKPLVSSMKSIVAKTLENFDFDFTATDHLSTSMVSDHFPIIGHFEFPLQPFGYEFSKTIPQNTNSNSEQAALFIILIIVLIIVILAFPVYFLVVRSKKIAPRTYLG
jgi:endonuclease/exonuclease/phosphatase family metal-dependent hydrolase